MFHCLHRSGVLLATLLIALGLIPTGWADDLTLDHALQTAVDSSYDLKISLVDVLLSKQDVKTACSDYFPTIRATANIEYLKDLENQPRPVTTIGTTVIPSGTRYQNSVGLSVNQNLLDFGVRKRKVDIAQKDVRAKSAIHAQQLRDLKLKVVELYTAALLSYKTIGANQSILDLSQQSLQLKKRLYDAGTLNKLDVSEEAIQMAQVLDEIETNKHQLEKQLADLSYYTHELYDSQSIALSDLPLTDTKTLPVFHAETSAEAKISDLEIAKKQKEVELLKRQALPQVSYYSYYNLYGFDPNRFRTAMANLSQRTVSFGLSVSMPVFDGFKNQAAIQHAKLEVEKLKLQKAQKLDELRHQALVYEKDVEGYGVQLTTKATIINKTQDKLTMLQRLSEQQMIEQTQAIHEHIQRIQRQLEAEKMLIQQISSYMKLTILATG